jgi:quinolinate synthase
MKLNTMQKVEAAMAGEGVKIDYLTPELMARARLPIERMMSFQA